jgi:hypothetical protein
MIEFSDGLLVLTEMLLTEIGYSEVRVKHWPTVLKQARVQTDVSAVFSICFIFGGGQIDTTATPKRFQSESKGIPEAHQRHPKANPKST